MSRPFFAFHFYKQKEKPLAVQLAEQLRTAIVKGAFLRDGDQLVSLREMMKISGCSLETVKKAYDQLVSQGWLTASQGKGYFLTDRCKRDRERAILNGDDHPVSSLTDATPVPTDDFIRRLRHAFAESLEALGENNEARKMRRSRAISIFSRHLHRRGLPFVPEQLYLFTRSVSGFRFLVQYLLKPGDVVFVEEFSYPHFVEILRHRGVKLRPVKLDSEGIQLDSLADEHGKEPADWLLVQPHFQFPTGLSYSRKRKQALLQWAEINGVKIIENDHYADFWFRRPKRKLFQLAAERNGAVPVFHLCSFSKTLSRELQVGMLIVPPNLPQETKEQLHHTFCLMSTEPSMLMLDAAAQLMDDPWFYETYMPERRAFFAARWQLLQQAACHALPRHACVHPIDGGLNAWISWGIESPQAGSQESRVIAILREEGLELNPGYAFRLPEDRHAVSRHPSVRFPFAPLEPREMVHWLTRLGAAMLR